MIPTAILIFVVLIAAYAAYSIPVIFQFRSYCERVAKATNRSEELKNHRSIDDGGNTAFEREQWSKLLRGEFGEFMDPTLATEAASLSRRVRLSFFLALGLVGGLAIILFAGLWLPRLGPQ
ncbi:hypothetical protein OOZ63_24320 [Paucibacter sp. PLA-PC-4]|uniref:hypothetical protein n=1 Tax=Paucibacter sp. PLA-PC-4 TaxID=2993655 RepID=UPI00224AD1D4|nr:hypothetical protein [Paucibacter sp. PLA-PC-4]MCX2864960.1 hypothetical protein [Paucibacter sp. PLA-PC-4]